MKHYSHRLNNVSLYIHNIPEHSQDDFDVSLRLLMAAASITQRELSRFLKTSNVTIHNYVTGKRKWPDIKLMRKIADYFDVKPSYFKEYRIYQLEERLAKHPKLIDIFLDLASNPAKIIEEYERIHQHDKELMDMQVKEKRLRDGK